MPKEETQKSQPQKEGVEPIEIPVPTRGQVFGDLARTAQPERPKRKRKPKK